MRRLLSLVTLLLVSLSALAPDAWAQSRPYIGFVYPAGGQQSTTFQVKIGGQNLSGLDGVVVSGAGVSARVVEYLNPLGNTEMALLSQQLRELKRTKSKTASTKKTKAAAASS